MKKLITDINAYIIKMYNNISWEVRYWTFWDVLATLFLIVLVLIVIALYIGLFAFALTWPLAGAWAINYFFATHIPISFTTWLAAWALIITFRLTFGKMFITITKK